MTGCLAFLVDACRSGLSGPTYDRVDPHTFCREQGSREFESQRPHS